MNDDDRQSLPSPNQPLHGPKRSTGKPLLLVLGILAALVILYILGTAFLV